MTLKKEKPWTEEEFEKIAKFVTRKPEKLVIKDDSKMGR